MTDVLPTIAVVDDDPGIRAALADLLHSAEFNPRTFPSAEAFLEQGLRERFDCLIADVHLPGISGVALLQALEAGGRSVPAVLITGREDPTTLELIRQVGPVPYLRKPFGDDELFDAMQRAMG